MASLRLDEDQAGNGQLGCIRTRPPKNRSLAARSIVAGSATSDAVGTRGLGGGAGSWAAGGDTAGDAMATFLWDRVLSGAGTIQIAEITNSLGALSASEHAAVYRSRDRSPI